MMYLKLALILLMTIAAGAGHAAALAQPYPHRLIWMWETIDGKLSHENKPAFFSSSDMLTPAAVPRYRRFAELLRSMKVNGLVVGAGPGLSFTRRLPELKALSEFLRGYGIGLYLSLPYTQDSKWRPAREYPDCPLRPEFAEYWNEAAEKLFRGAPLIKGCVMKGMGYENVSGPLSCQCELCRRTPEPERVLAALNAIAASLAKYQGTLYYRTWTTGTLQDVEFNVFRDLAGRLPENVVLVSKKGYGDFMLREFPHPLFGRIHPKTQHVAELQVFGEYRGKLSNPCQMVTRWRDWLDQCGDKIDGLLGIVEVDRDTFDHPLNMVNWHAFGEYASNPQARPEDIFRAWAEKSYGEVAAPAVLSVVKRTDSATEKLMYFKGVCIQNHSMLPERKYLDSHLRGPWPGVERDESRIGWGRPLDMYSAADRQRYASDPRMALFCGRALITPALLGELSNQQAEAVRDFESMLSDWTKAQPRVSKWAFLDIKRRLERSLADARIWQINTDIYIRWLLGEPYGDLLDRLEALEGLAGTDLTRGRIAPIVADYRAQERSRASVGVQH